VCKKQIIEIINQVVVMSLTAREVRGPVIRGNIVGRIGRRGVRRMWVADEGIGCETMRCCVGGGSIQCKVSENGCSDEEGSTELPCQGRGTTA